MTSHDVKSLYIDDDGVLQHLLTLVAEEELPWALLPGPLIAVVTVRLLNKNNIQNRTLAITQWLSRTGTTGIGGSSTRPTVTGASDVTGVHHWLLRTRSTSVSSPGFQTPRIKSLSDLHSKHLIGAKVIKTLDVDYYIASACLDFKFTAH